MFISLVVLSFDKDRSEKCKKDKRESSLAEALDIRSFSLKNTKEVVWLFSTAGYMFLSLSCSQPAHFALQLHLSAQQSIQFTEKG